MRSRLPPLNALKAFEAAARHESFTRAAEELCVTQGAVSHQVKALEEELALKLFNRERQRLIITEAGRDYLAVVRDALDRIAMGTERLLQRQNSGVLTVSTSPDFAAKWLVHRLGHFAEAHPGIDLRVSGTLHHVDFAREEVDLAVRHGDGNWPGLDAVRLSPEQLFAVCSPKLVSGKRRIGKPADILKYPLLHMDSRADWKNWLQEAGLDDAAATHGPVLNRASMVIDAAINGQGIALARTTLAAWDLIKGHLVRPFAQALPLNKAYWILCPKATASLPKIVTFRDWLLAEAASDLRQLQKKGFAKVVIKAAPQGSCWKHPRRVAGVAAVMLALLLARPLGTRAQDIDKKTIVFVCQHGVVNSQMAGAHFNKIARERGLPFTAVSRGIDSEYRSVPVRIEDELALDGLAPANTPRELTADEAGRAHSLLAFDTIPAEQRGGASVVYWSGIPLGINAYEATRDQIIQRIDALLPTLASEPAR